MTEPWADLPPATDEQKAGINYYTATYQPADNRWELRTKDLTLPVAYNCDLHPMDTDGAREWVTRVVTVFDTAPDYVGVTGGATPTVHAATGGSTR